MAARCSVLQLAACGQPQSLSLALQFPGMVRGYSSSVGRSISSGSGSSSSPSDGAAALAGGGSAVQATLINFRRNAGPYLSEAAAAGSSSISVGSLSASLRDAATKNLQATFGEASGSQDWTSCEAQLEQETQQALVLVSELEGYHKERTRLKEKRADLLAVGFQTTGAENQEFASLVVCASAGIFAVSIHWGFFSIFAVSYALYRRSTVAVRKQRKATDDLQDTVDRLKELVELEAERISSLRAHAEAWAQGNAVP